MIRQPGPTPKRPPSARTPGGPTPARTAGWMPGSTGVNSTTQPLRSCTTPDAPPRARRWRSPRRRGRGVESDQVAAERGRLDAVIAGLLFMAGMRRSEVSALRWADVANATDDDGMLVTVRRSKTNQEGEVNDVRVRQGRRRARAPDATRRHESGAGGPREAIVAADGGVTVVMAKGGEVSSGTPAATRRLRRQCSLHRVGALLRTRLPRTGGRSGRQHGRLELLRGDGVVSTARRHSDGRHSRGCRGNRDIRSCHADGSDA